MLLSELPCELLREIFIILAKKDPRSFLNLSMACKRLYSISRDIPGSIDFKEARLERKNWLECNDHEDSIDMLSQLQDAGDKNYCGLRLSLKLSSPARELLRSPLYISRTLSCSKLDTIVELELAFMTLTLDWLDACLNAIPNILFLTLFGLKISSTSTGADLNITSEIRLREFKLDCEFDSREFRETFFMYLMRKISTKTLNVTTMEFFRAKGEFALFHKYLKHIHSTVECLVTGYNDITPSNLKAILLDEELGHLKVKANICSFMLSFYGRMKEEQIIAEVGEENYRRIEIEYDLSGPTMHEFVQMIKPVS